eukprot:gene8172-14101_t
MSFFQNYKFSQLRAKSHTSKSDVDVLYIVNLGEVINRIDLFRKYLPNVEPFYAVKCNPDPVVLKLLGASNLGFDCASKEEIKAVLKTGVLPNKIIFSHTIKKIPHIQFAKKHNISILTFDSESELNKIKMIYQDAKLVMRIFVDSSKAGYPMGTKFGVKESSTRGLLEKAKQLQLNVIGVSSCLHIETYEKAIKAARKTFDEASSLGFQFTLLDIGGGFPGAKGTESTFVELAETLQLSFKEHFPSTSGVRIIAEPGRYFVDSAFSCASEIIAVKISGEGTCIEDDSDKTQLEYYLTNSIFTSFGFPEREVVPMIIKECVGQERYPSFLWGVTCCPIDHIAEDVLLPKMEVGDLLFFESMGAYSLALSCRFNGYGNVKICYVVPESKRDRLLDFSATNGYH